MNPKSKRDLGVLHFQRQLAVKFHLEGVYTQQGIASMCGLSVPSVKKAVDLYKSGGIEALVPKPRGYAPGTHCLLTQEEQAAVRHMITTWWPVDYGLDYGVWNASAIAQLIEIKLMVKLHPKTVCDYLKRWKFTSQKPVKRAYEQDPRAEQEWKEVHFPKLKKKADDESADILFGDQTCVQNTDLQGKGFSPKGKTPVVCTSGGHRKKFALMSAIGPNGVMHWMPLEKSLTWDLLIQFFQMVLTSATRKTFMVLDNLSVHHCRKVQDWLAARKDRIEVFYLPAYSPQLNPDEWLNANLKKHMRSKAVIRTGERLRETVSNFMNHLMKMPDRIISFFKDKHTVYAL